MQESRDQATQPGDGGDVSSNEEEEVETEESKAEVEDDLPVEGVTEVPGRRGDTEIISCCSAKVQHVLYTSLTASNIDE